MCRRETEVRVSGGMDGVSYLVFGDVQSLDGRIEQGQGLRDCH